MNQFKPCFACWIIKGVKIMELISSSRSGYPKHYRGFPCFENSKRIFYVGIGKKKDKVSWYKWDIFFANMFYCIKNRKRTSSTGVAILIIGKAGYITICYSSNQGSVVVFKIFLRQWLHWVPLKVCRCIPFHRHLVCRRLLIQAKIWCYGLKGLLS